MSTAKEQLRRAARRERDEISGPAAAAAAEAAARHLLALPPVRTAATVALYSPVRGELDPGPAGRELAARGVRVVYPRTVDGDRLLTFHEADDLLAGAFGILEPHAAAPLVPLDRIDLFVVPGLAFDRTGARLGWGLGFYDRTLAHTAAVRIGYCYACQVVPAVPHEPYDLPMDHLVTEDGALSAT
ncbi:MAG TPA: 5-formyltetrahydrofolate cyclo-ligase [Kofleriaceae bacterium]|nr:5-formyltetrahydrofolate cyclo-ligase [Kofleriaceae bacterium]